VAKKTLKINTKTKRAHNLRGATSTASGHSRAITLTWSHDVYRSSGHMTSIVLLVTWRLLFCPSWRGILLCSLLKGSSSSSSCCDVRSEVVMDTDLRHICDFREQKIYFTKVRVAKWQQYFWFCSFHWHQHARFSHIASFSAHSPHFWSRETPDGRSFLYHDCNMLGF